MASEPDAAGGLTPEQEELLALLLAESAPEAESSDASLVVPLQTQGTGPALFSVGVFHFRPLAAHLRWDGPFYGILGEDVDPNAAYHGQVEGLAAQYVEVVRRVQPQGPYHLVGYCFGGLVAYEMACQLQQVGEDVALLALVDTTNPRTDEAEARLLEETARATRRDKLRAHWEALREKGVPYLGVAARQRARYEHVRWTMALKRFIHDVCRHTRLPMPPWLEGTGTFEAEMAAAAAYRPKRFRGPLTLFLSVSDGHEHDASAEGDWKTVAGGPIEVVPLASKYHMDVLKEPRVEQLAAALGRRIGRAKAEGRRAITDVAA